MAAASYRAALSVGARQPEAWNRSSVDWMKAAKVCVCVCVCVCVRVRVRVCV